MSLNWEAKPYFLNPAEEWNLHPPQQRQFSQTASVTTDHFAALVNLLAVKSVLCLDFHVKIKRYKILNVVIPVIKNLFLYFIYGLGCALMEKVFHFNLGKKNSVLPPCVVVKHQ